MKKVDLAVSPLVAAILTSRYGHPVVVHRSDALYTYLQGDPIRVSKRKFKKLANELTRNITVEVSSTIARRLLSRKRQLKIGLYLHKIYQEEMLNFMQAQHEVGVPAQTALKTYLQTNGVDEDDYALDTAYTAWKRKKEFFRKKMGVSPGQSAPRETNAERIVPTDPREILLAINFYYGCGMCNLLCRHLTAQAGAKSFTYMYDQDTSALHRKPRKVAAYLLRKDAALCGTEIAKIIHLSPRTIQKYIQQSRFHLDYYTDIQHDVARIRRLYSR